MNDFVLAKTESEIANREPLIQTQVSFSFLSITLIY